MAGENTEASLRPNWKAIVLIGVVTSAVLTVVFLAITPRDIETAMKNGRYDVAAELLERQALAENAEAQNTLGSLYYVGLGVKRDHRLAAKWFLKAALNENSSAQVNIARHYNNGWGVKRDELRAYGWLRQARINGNELAENYMKWQAGSMALVPNQMQRAIELYDDLEDLIASEEKGGL